MVNDQSGVPKLSGSFEGILDLTSSTEMDISFLAFKDISKTYNAGYTP